MITFYDRRIGIEIENESTAVTSATVGHELVRLGDAALWVLDLEEGSLRAGRMGWEVKSINPGVPVCSIDDALNQLYPILYGSSGNWRAAVHVHVDTANVDLLQAFALAYVLDEALFNRFSPERVESNFCVPLDYNMYDVRKQLELFGCGRDSYRIWHGYNKYRSVNVCALERFDTIEFRHMKTPETSGHVTSVRDALEQIKAYALACARIMHDTQIGMHNSMVEMFERIEPLQYGLGIRQLDEERIYNVLQVCDRSPRVDGIGPELTALLSCSPMREAEPRRNRYAEMLENEDTPNEYLSEIMADIGTPPEASRRINRPPRHEGVDIFTIFHETGDGE